MDRERLELSDGDFIDLDWSDQKYSRLAIIGHGLEGESCAKYMLGMSAALQRRELGHPCVELPRLLRRTQSSLTFLSLWAQR